MRNRSYLLFVLGLILAGTLAPRVALADAHTYTSVRRTIRTAIVTSSALNVPAPNGPSPENPDPHVFYIADSSALKPLGVEFMNPLAPPVITSSIYQRWLNRVRNGAYDPAFDNMNQPREYKEFQVGAKVTKNMGPYWEINIDNLSDDDLKQFDLLYLHAHVPNTQFPADQREKLRRFVESGGTLWVENCGRFSFSNSAPFLYDVNMNSGTNGAASAVVANPNHPLLSYPFVLTPQEVQRIGDKFVNDYYLYAVDPTNPNGGAPGPNPVNPPGAQTLIPIVWNTRGLPAVNQIQPNPSWRPYIAAGPVGGGTVIYSSGDSGCAINDYVGGSNAGYGGNSATISGTQFLAAHPQDLKFLYNLAVWSGSHMTGNTDPRRSNGTDEKLGAALVQKWAAPSPGTAHVAGATFYKHAVFSVDGNLVLHAYDSNPGQDLDGDGNADDGMPDYIGGTSTDELWRLNLTGVPGVNNPTGASTPTVIEFYDPTFTGTTGGLVNYSSRELVVVVLSDGSVVAVRAFPRDATKPNFPIAPVTRVDWVITPAVSGAVDFNLNGTNLPIPTPAWTEGVLIVGLSTTNGGRLAAIDPRAGTSAFRLSQNIGVGQAMIPDVPGVPPIVGSPTAGYVLDNASGARDKMVYAYHQRVSGGGGQNLPETIRAFPFMTKGEPLTSQGGGIWNSRSILPWYIYDIVANNPADGNALLRQRIYCTYRDTATGTTYSLELRYNPGAPGATEYTVQYTPGQPVRVQIGNTITWPGGTPSIPSTDPNLAFFADYTLDWSTATTSKVNARSVMTAPDPTGAGNRIGGTAALSGNDLVMYTVDTTNGQGANQGRGVLFAVNEQSGANRTAMKWAYTMHNGFQMPVEGQTVTIPPRLRNVEIGTAFITGTQPGAYLTDVQFVGSPAYRNGVAYAVARATLGSGGPPVSVLCAFKANPDIRLRLNVKIDPGTLVRVRQPNIVNSQAGNLSWVELNQQQYTIDYDSGLIRITSMALPGTTAQFASNSMPFVVKVGNAPEQLIAGTQIDTVQTGPMTTAREGRLIGPEGVDNLLWYAIIPAGGTAVSGSPFNGVGLVSTSPSIQGDIVWLGFANGFVASIDADPAATDPAAQAAGAQVALLDFDTTTGTATLRHLRWMQQIDATLNPTVLSAPVGTANVLAVNTRAGLIAYEDTYTIIADNKRLIEVNAGGEAVWTCDGTRTYGVAGGDLPQYIFDPGTGNIIPINPANATGVAAVQKVAFARPTVARRIGVNDLIVVDTGNNRVVQVDRGGNVVWEVNRLQDDMKGLMRPGDPLTLNEPTDCSYWTEFLPNIQINSPAPGGPYTYNGPAYVIHYLIADTGNHRVIELVDVYDQGGRPVTPTNGGTPAPFSLLRQVNFVSNTLALQGKKYKYRTVQRLVMRNSDLPAEWRFDPNSTTNPPAQLPNNAIRYLTLALVSNYRLVGDPNPAKRQQTNTFGNTAESTGGSIVLLHEGGGPLSIVSDLRIPTGAMTARSQAITNPTFLQKFDELDTSVNPPVLAYKYLLADANGCYQMTPGVDPSTGAPVMNVEWLISADDYYRMTGKKLIASSIKRLSSTASAPNAGLHRFLITNQFTGEDNPAVFGVNYVNGVPTNANVTRGEFHGEVFELDPTFFSFAAVGHGYRPDYVLNGGTLVPNPQASIKWRTPTEQVPGLAQIGPIRRFIGSRDRATTTSVLEQPAFADRPF